MPMTPEKYSVRRDELLTELEKIMAIKGLPADTSKELKAVSRKLISNVFNIVLIGEFQGGKSTTFNSICDGREISPRGAMVKTSACKISAQNLPDPDTEEYAILEWKRQDELLLTMIEIVAPYLRKKAPTRFEGKTDAEMVKDLRLSNADDVSLLKACLDAEWGLYKESPADYDPDAKGKLDILYIARLIIENCSATEYCDKLDGAFPEDGDNDDPEPIRTKIKIPELAKYVVFPERWSTGDADAFSRDEVAFAFLGSVMCYLHSPNLARLGCVITDCPGLFASPWDTSVAEQAMMTSDAILYLIGGQKAMSDSDLRALKEIRRTGQDHKLFFAVNAKIKRDLLKSQIVPADVGFLHNAGFTKASEANLYIFHSLLGLCSRNGVAIKNDTFESISTDRFVRVAHYVDGTYPNKATELWPLLVEDLLGNYLSRSELAEKGAYINDVAALGDVSGLNALLDVIEKTVVLKKAEALLVSGGSKPINAAMALLEEDLRNREAIATKKADEFAQEEKKAKSVLDTFANEATQAIDEILEPRNAAGLASDFFDNVILANSDELSDRVSGQFSDNVLCFSNIFKSLNKEALKRQLEPIIKDATTAVLKPAISGWLQNIQSGENLAYQDTLLSKRKLIVDTLKRKWAELNPDESNGLLAGLDRLIGADGGSPLAPPDVEPDFTALRGSVLQGRVKMLVSTILAIPLGVAMGIIVTIAVDFVLASAFAVILGLIPTLLVILAGVIFGLKISDAIKAKVKNAVKDKLRTELRVSFTKPDVKKQMLDAGSKIVFELQKMMHTGLKAVIDRQYSVFEKRRQDAAAAFAVGDAERQKISDEARQLRVNDIEPAHAWCEQFESSVTSELEV